MFNFSERVITKVLNPLKVTKNSMIEFNIGELKGKGMYKFMKIIELLVGERTYARYLIYSKLEDSEFIFEVFSGNNDQFECYLYKLFDVVPFSEEFLDVVGQRYLTTPDGIEYERCIMPNNEDRIDGLSGKIKVYNIETGEIEKESEIQVWDYQRDVDGITEYLNVEMSETTGEFRIFKGEIIESIFYKFYQNLK